jgi:hypothetical protein
LHGLQKTTDANMTGAEMPALWLHLHGGLDDEKIVSLDKQTSNHIFDIVQERNSALQEFSDDLET